jgi:hypothetical protein
LNAEEVRILPPRACIVVLLALASAACAQHSIDRAGRSVQIAPDLSLTLPRPADLGQSIEVMQLVTARYGDQTYAFEARVSATANQFLMVGLDSLGRRAMTITWSDAAISYESAPWLPPQLRPENVLADMVLLYWPEAAVSQALAPSGGVVMAVPGRRTIAKAGEPIIQIEYGPSADGSPWAGTLRYRNLAFHYEMDVQSVRSSP